MFHPQRLPIPQRNQARRLHNILDLPPVKFHLRQFVQIPFRHAPRHAIHRNEVRPYFPSRYGVEFGIGDGDVDSRVECCVEGLDAVGG
jgi:hypothetical protein